MEIQFYAVELVTRSFVGLDALMPLHQRSSHLRRRHHLNGFAATQLSVGQRTSRRGTLLVLKWAAIFMCETIQQPRATHLSTQLNDNLRTQVSDTSMSASIYSLLYNKNYNPLISCTELSPIPVRSAAKWYLAS